MQHLLSDIPWVILQTLSAALRRFFLSSNTHSRAVTAQYQRKNPANRNLDFQSRNKPYSSAVKQVIYFTQFKCHAL